MKILDNQHILLGISGGIAAYKSAELVRRLREQGAKVRVVMTASATEFVTPLTFQALSGEPVHHALLDEAAEAGMGHIELARWADCVLVAPATANFIAKLAHGHADDLLTTLCLCTRAPIAIAPAMNQYMWHNTATQDNINRLTERGVLIWGPEAGAQACGEIGLGRMLEPEALVARLADQAAAKRTIGSLAGLSILMTAGPTRERLDAVRYLTNDSSGKMGYALAQAAHAAGAQVTLISGPVALKTPLGVDCQQVTSALEMYDAVMQRISGHAIFICAAAVADYRCETILPRKMKKTAAPLTLALVPNPDIVTAVSALTLKPFIVGFAAETEDVLSRAAAKREAKGMDMIVANQVGIPGQGFDSDENAATVLWRGGQQSYSLTSKTELAKQLINLIGRHYEQTKDTA